MRLILIRHAETSGNRRRYVGREDLPLNQAGRLQVGALTAALSAETITDVYSSPLVRAVSTAEPIANQRNLAVIARPALVEIDFGSLQGSFKVDRQLSLRQAHLHQPIPGGESLADVWNRLAPFVTELRANLLDGRRPAIIGHYWCNRLLLDQLRGLALDEALCERNYKPANASALAVDLEARTEEWMVQRTRWITAHRCA